MLISVVCVVMMYPDYTVSMVGRWIWMWNIGAMVTDMGKLKYLGRNSSQCQYGKHKSAMNCPG